jgi:hypothetical protein
MDRVFLAVIASGLLLAATSMSLFVATGGGTRVAELKLPPSALTPQHVRLRMQENTTLARDDSAR